MGHKVLMTYPTQLHKLIKASGKANFLSEQTLLKSQLPTER